MGFDMIFEDAIGPTAIRTAISAVTRTEPGRVAVIHDLAEYATVGRMDAVVVLYPKAGPFKTLASIDWAGTVWEQSNRAFAVHLAAHFGCRGLISDGGDNPYRMLLVTADGRVTAVFLSVEAMDGDEEEYQIDRECGDE